MSATEPLLHDDVVAFGEEDFEPNVKKGSLAHPYVTFFHLAFKAASIFAYLMCAWFSDSFIASFVTIVILLSIDFWTVKNITGRLMVGLRWWNYVDDDGQSHWIFESKKGQSQNRINDREVSIFWTALILTPFIWGLLFLTSLFMLNLKWMLLVTIAMILNGANVYGYLQCKVGSSSSITTATTDFLRKQVLQNAISMVTRQTTNQVPSSDVRFTNTI